MVILFFYIFPRRYGTMGICLRRQLIYPLLLVPVVVYLVLVVCMITGVFPRSGLDPTETDFRAKYQALVRLLLDHTVARDLGLDSDNIGADLRKLLDLDAKTRNLKQSRGRKFEATLERLLQESGGNLYWRQDDGVKSAAKHPADIPVSKMQSWQLDRTDRGSDISSKSQEVYMSFVQHALVLKPQNIHNCSTISSMRVRTQVGHGVSKQAFLADYQGTEVVIKMVTRHALEVKNCLKRLREAKTALANHQKSTKTNLKKMYNSVSAKNLLAPLNRQNIPTEP